MNFKYITNCIYSMEQLNYHKLINLKKRLVKYDCEYSKKIMATIDECIVSAKAVSNKHDRERRDNYQLEDVTCETCGNEYPRGYIYKHKRDKHGAVSSKTKKVSKVDEVLEKLLADLNAIKEEK